MPGAIGITENTRATIEVITASLCIMPLP